MWNLFLDDIRNPNLDYCFDLTGIHIARNTEEAKSLVLNNGMPEFMFLDHDLGGNDTTMKFLNWLVYEYWDGKMNIPQYSVHSSNPCGVQNILSFMESWKKSINS